MSYVHFRFLSNLVTSASDALGTIIIIVNWYSADINIAIFISDSGQLALPSRTEAGGFGIIQNRNKKTLLPVE